MKVLDVLIYKLLYSKWQAFWSFVLDNEKKLKIAVITFLGFRGRKLSFYWTLNPSFRRISYAKPLKDFNSDQHFFGDSHLSGQTYLSGQKLPVKKMTKQVTFDQRGNFWPDR